MTDSEVEAELFAPVTSGIFSVDWLRDAETGIWRSPVPRAEQHDLMRRMYLWQTNTTDPAPFDRVFPLLWRLPSEPRSPDRVTLAILDTGCLTAHPLLSGCIEETRDFTDEGIEDRIGHGTGCALIARLMPYGGWRPRLLIGKVFSQDRRDVSRRLIQGIEWAADLARSLDSVVNIVLRLGLYNRRWLGLRSCDGTCDVCRAALRALEDPRIRIDAAPGNRAGQTACPASAALRLQRQPQATQPRFVSMAPGQYADAGIGTDRVEGNGRYSFATDTVTLFPPRLFCSTLPMPAMAAAVNAAIQSSGEPFYADIGSWRIARDGNRVAKVAYWPDAAGTTTRR